jgi:hypothetical protein
VVLMSAAGTKEAPKNSIGGAYWMGEQHLIKMARHWTILRMNCLADEPVAEIVQYGEPAAELQHLRFVTDADRATPALRRWRTARPLDTPTSSD